MSKLTLFVVSGKIDRVGRLHGRSKFSSELVWRSWVAGRALRNLGPKSRSIGER